MLDWRTRNSSKPSGSHSPCLHLNSSHSWIFASATNRATWSASTHQLPLESQGQNRQIGFSPASSWIAARTVVGCFNNGGAKYGLVRFNVPGTWSKFCWRWELKLIPSRGSAGNDLQHVSIYASIKVSQQMGVLPMTPKRLGTLELPFRALAQTTVSNSVSGNAWLSNHYLTTSRINSRSFPARDIPHPFN